MINEENTEALYTPTAGLVICSPFFPNCFKLLDYLEENSQFKDEASLNRAVYLLHFIATGTLNSAHQIIPEQVLVLPKLLCGLPLEYSLDETITLSENEIATALELLNAVIGNWDKISSSTVENLRGSFLIREGLLFVADSSYELKVSGAGYDILLSFLPWHIDRIALPWMDTIIQVDWNQPAS